MSLLEINQSDRWTNTSYILGPKFNFPPIAALWNAIQQIKKLWPNVMKLRTTLLKPIFEGTSILIEKVHLDDLDLYVITFIALAMSVLLWSSVLKLTKKFNSTSFNLKQEVFIRRDEEKTWRGWYILNWTRTHLWKYITLFRSFLHLSWWRPLVWGWN